MRFKTLLLAAAVAATTVPLARQAKTFRGSRAGGAASWLMAPA